jgi:hypothetical protein
VLRNQLLHGLRHKLLALAESHHIDVVFGQQPHVICRCGERAIAREKEAPVAVDLDLLEIEAVEQGLRLRDPEQGRREPLREIGGTCWAVGT